MPPCRNSSRPHLHRSANDGVPTPGKLQSEMVTKRESEIEHPTRLRPVASKRRGQKVVDKKKA